MTLHAAAYRKIRSGVATMSDLRALVDRVGRLPGSETIDGAPQLGDWLEIDKEAFREASTKAPRLFAGRGVFATSERTMGSVISVYFAIRIRGYIRWFHGFCDRPELGNIHRMRVAIIAAETAAINATTKDSKLGFLRNPFPPRLSTLPIGRRRMAILRRLGAEIDAASVLPERLSDEDIDAYLNDGQRDPAE